MKQRTTCWAALVAGAILLAGCEETAPKQQSHARPPANAPAPVPVPAFVRETLPFPDHVADLSALQAHARPGVDILIEKVQASFAAGQKAYKAGDFDGARLNFDHAVDLIMASGIPVDSDPRLSDLFDQIGDAVHGYEGEALQNAEEEPDNTGVPAPIDELADLTLPPGDPRLASKAEQELMWVQHDLPLTVNASVLQYLSYFTTARGRAIVEHGLERAGRYNEMIRRVLKEEGVPQDLIYLAQAESAFKPEAVSRAGARGIWQFMPYRGEEYDLERTYWIDQRSDPEKSTRAAAHHMRDLYAMFGDWYLVMAAYNSGPLNVVKAVEWTGYADFWELQKRNVLPKQTRNYVPIIVAMALVGKDPALYGVQVAPDKPPMVDKVRPGHPVDLHLVADASGADVDDLRELNPELLRGVTPNDAQFELKMPVGTAEKFKENIQQVPADKWTSWRLHAVEGSETLSEVARHYRVTVLAIENANHLEARATVPAGFLLNVPTAPPVVRLVHYRVQRGDTLEGIADRFDVTVTELKRWNHISGKSVPRGSRLKIYAGGQPPDNSRAKPKSAQSSGSPAVRNVSDEKSGNPETVQHRVKRGETLYSIARTYGTTVSSLRQSNPFLADRQLAAGDLLNIQR
jgi:membrane-bound lytic murein transglycosylase D